MALELLALGTAALFTGAAAYVGFAEQPARLGLDDRSLLIQWKAAYSRGAVMQGSLALLGLLLGMLAWLQDGSALLLAGALLIGANWPYTLAVVRPVNRRLMAIGPETGDPDIRSLIARWGGLHAARTGLGAVASLCFLVAAWG